MDPSNVYLQLHDQLPTALKWLLGVLTLGFSSLAGYLFRRQVLYIERIEKQVNDRIDREMHEVNGRLDSIYSNVILIARNTGTNTRDK